MASSQTGEWHSNPAHSNVAAYSDNEPDAEVRVPLNCCIAMLSCCDVPMRSTRKTELTLLGSFQTILSMRYIMPNAKNGT